MAEWVLEASSFYATKFKRYQKRHPVETAAALDNLDTFFRTLSVGVKPARIHAGFIHREPHGVGVKGDSNSLCTPLREM